MRIDGRTEQLSKLQGSLLAVGHQEPARDRAQDIRRKDQVTLSAGAQEVKGFYEALSTVPPERAERVAALRQAIESGRYEIPEDELIDRLMGVVNPR
jgi:flagellar biosynthesis anti-sigma factor FlgM